MTVTTATRRTTPTGYLVSTAAPASDEWFATRREGITGTDLPKILGISQYGNALSVWLDKRDELEDPGAGEAAMWGTVFEDVIARVWAEKNKVAVRRVGILSHDTAPWQRASLDRLVQGCPDGGRCGLEVKLRSAYKASDYVDDVPDDVLAQVAWGRHVTGLDHMHIAVNVGGQMLRSFRYDRDEELESFLIEEATRIWGHVVDERPPDVVADGDGVLLDLLNRMYATREGDRDVDVDKALLELERYDAAHAAASAADREKTAAKTALIEMLGDGDAAVIPDGDGKRVLYTYRRPAPATGMPAAEVKRLRKEDPDLFERLAADGYLIESQAGPRFNRKK